FMSYRLFGSGHIVTYIALGTQVHELKTRYRAQGADRRRRRQPLARQKGSTFRGSQAHRAARGNRAHGLHYAGCQASRTQLQDGVGQPRSDEQSRSETAGSPRERRITRWWQPDYGPRPRACTTLPIARVGPSTLTEANASPSS